MSQHISSAPAQLTLLLPTSTTKQPVSTARYTSQVFDFVPRLSLHVYEPTLCPQIYVDQAFEWTYSAEIVKKGFLNRDIVLMESRTRPEIATSIFNCRRSELPRYDVSSGYR
jgi:hypothetical protein